MFADENSDFHIFVGTPAVKATRTKILVETAYSRTIHI